MSESIYKKYELEMRWVWIWATFGIQTWSYSIWLNGRSILSFPMMKRSHIYRIPFHTARDNSSLFLRNTGSMPCICGQKIVEGILGEMHFHPVDKEGVLNIFQETMPCVTNLSPKSFTTQTSCKLSHHWGFL